MKYLDLNVEPEVLCANYKQKALMKRLKTLCAVTAAMCCVVAYCHASLVPNGSFENGGFVHGVDDTMDLPGGSTVITGWTVTTANLAWIGPSNPFGLTASEGDYFLDLSGYHDNQPYGGVAASASISTVIGQQYRVGFDLGSDSRFNSASPSVQVNVTGNPASATFTASALGTVINRWEIFGLEFTATAANTTISFVGVGADNQAYIGLDNVSFSAVPESSTMIAGALMLLPVGFQCMRHLRHRKQA